MQLAQLGDPAELHERAPARLFGARAAMNLLVDQHGEVRVQLLGELLIDTAHGDPRSDAPGQRPRQCPELLPHDVVLACGCYCSSTRFITAAMRSQLAACSRSCVRPRGVSA